MCRRKTTINSRISKFKNNQHWLFKPKYKKPHLEILGSLIVWVCFPFSEPAWSAPHIETAAISVSKLDQKENTVITFASKGSDTKLNSEILPTFRAGAAGRDVLQRESFRANTAGEAERDFLLHVSCSRLSQQGERSSSNRSQENISSPSPGVPTPPASIEHQTPANTAQLKKVIREGKVGELGKRRQADPSSIEILAPEQRQPCNPTPPSVAIDAGSSPTPDTEASKTGNRSDSKQTANGEDPELGNLRLRELERPPTPIEETSPIRNRSDLKQTANGEDPELGNLRLQELERPPTPINETSPIGNRSDSEQPAKGEDPELGNLRLQELERPPTPINETSPIGNRSDSEQPAKGEDPELGNLRLRELETPPAPSKPAVYLLGGVSYLRSNNVFSDIQPVDDGFVRGGLTLLANPSLGPQTSLFASVGGNLIRYSSQSQFDYNELRLNLGIRQELSPRTYGEVGWINRQLFDQESGDRFLNDHSLYLELGRRDSLAKQLSLDTYYQFRFSFADPTNRSQVINSVGASLAYNLSASLQVALDYQFALADFTEQNRQDQYHQLIARLTYTISPNSRLYLFGGRSFGNSSDPTIDFNGFIFGAGVDFNLTLF